MNKIEFEQKVVSQSDRIYPMMYRMLNDRDLVLDAMQEVMIKLWQRRKKIALHPNLPAFIFLTARNHCLDVLKKKQPYFEYSDVLLRVSSKESGDTNMEKKELYSIIEELLKSLPDQQGEVLLMRDLDGMEYGEIASTLNLKIEHVRVLISRARKQIAEKLKNLYSYE